MRTKILYHFTVEGSDKAAKAAVELVDLLNTVVYIRHFEENTYLLTVELKDEDELAKVGKFLERL